VPTLLVDLLPPVPNRRANCRYPRRGYSPALAAVEHFADDLLYDRVNARADVGTPRFTVTMPSDSIVIAVTGTSRARRAFINRDAAASIFRFGFLPARNIERPS